MEYKALLKNDTVLEDPCIRIENCSGATSSIIIPMGHRYVSIWPAFLFTIKKRSFEAGIVKLAFILQRFYLLRIYVCVCGFVCVWVWVWVCGCGCVYVCGCGCVWVCVWVCGCVCRWVCVGVCGCRCV